MFESLPHFAGAAVCFMVGWRVIHKLPLSWVSYVITGGAYLAGFLASALGVDILIHLIAPQAGRFFSVLLAFYFFLFIVYRTHDFLRRNK